MNVVGFFPPKYVLSNKIKIKFESTKNASAESYL